MFQSVGCAEVTRLERLDVLALAARGFPKVRRDLHADVPCVSSALQVVGSGHAPRPCLRHVASERARGALFRKISYQSSPTPLEPYGPPSGAPHLAYRDRLQVQPVSNKPITMGVIGYEDTWGRVPLPPPPFRLLVLSNYFNNIDDGPFRLQVQLSGTKPPHYMLPTRGRLNYGSCGIAFRCLLQR